MSTHLRWEPLKHNTVRLPDELKFALRKRYGEPVNSPVSTQDIPYIEGLRDAGIKGAQELIEAINKHSEVRVTEE